MARKEREWNERGEGRATEEKSEVRAGGGVRARGGVRTGSRARGGIVAREKEPRAIQKRQLLF